jgi:hypothetical protein
VTTSAQLNPDREGTAMDQQDINLPDQQPGAVPESSEPAPDEKWPSGVDHPHALDANHLRPATPRREGVVSDPDFPVGT